MSKVVSVVFVSLAAWQVHRQRLIVFRVTAERQRWRGWGKVEGRLSGHCGPALTQLTTATDAGAVSPWWRHVFGLVCTRRWINHPLAHAKSFGLNAHMCIWVRQQQRSCWCVEPGPAWLSCSVTELCDQTDESLKVNTVFKVSHNVSHELSNSVF